MYKEITKEYQVVDLRNEYKGFVGKESYAIVTDLSEEELNSSFSQELEPYRPFVIITNDMYEAFIMTETNDEREKWRERKYHTELSPEALFHLINEMSDPISICESIHNLEYITARMLELPDHQGSRIYKIFILGFTAEELANEEGRSIYTIWQSLRLGKNKLRDVFVECGVVA